MFRFDHWAQPVKSRRWAVICSALWYPNRLFLRRPRWLAALTGRLHHGAWERACGLR